MALPFKTYATIGGKRYRIFKPKEFPDKVFAYDIEQKTAHRIDESILKLLNIDKATFRPYQIPNILVGISAGQEWNESWYKQKFEKTGPVKASFEPKKIPGLDQISELAKKVAFGQKSDEVRQLQDLLKDAGYFPTPKLSTGYYGQITKQAIEAFEKKNVKAPDYKSFDTQRGYALIREKDTLEVYTLDPKTGQARWLTAEAVRPAGFDLKKVTEVPKGYVGQFTMKEKWTPQSIKDTTTKLKKAIDASDKAKEFSSYKEKQDKFKTVEQVKRWSFETKADAAKAVNAYADFLKSPILKTDQVTPAFAKKAFDYKLSDSDVVANELKDYGKITQKEKDKLDKQYGFDPAYGNELIKKAQIERQKIESEEKLKVGFIDPETGEDKFPVSLDLETAIKEINKETEHLDNLQKEFINKVKEYQEKLKESETYKGQSESLYKDIDKLETQIVFEESEDNPDKEKLNNLKTEYNKARDKVNAFNLKYKPITNALTNLEKELTILESKSENIRAKFDKENMSTKWANLYALIDYNTNMEARVNEWIRVEEKGIIQLYETGTITSSQAIERLNANISDPKDYYTTKIFKDFLSDKTIRRRKQSIKHEMAEIFMKTAESDTEFNIAVDTLKNTLKEGWKVVEKGMNIYSAHLTVPFQLLADIKEFRGMSKEMDTFIDTLPTAAKIKKMSPEQREKEVEKLLAIQVTANKIIKEMPVQQGDTWLERQNKEAIYMAKSLADKVWNTDWSEVDLYEALEGDLWVKEKYRSGVKGSLGLILAAYMFRDGMRNDSTYTNIFKNINKKIIPTISHLGGGPYVVAKNLALNKFLGKAFKNTIGSGYTKYITGPYGIPTINNVIKSSFASAWGKNFPKLLKAKIQKIGMTKAEQAEAKILYNLEKKIEEFAPTPAAKKRLSDIISQKVKPDELFYSAKAGEIIKDGKTANELAFEFLAEIDPAFYGELKKLRDLGFEMKEMPKFIAALSKGGKLKAEMTFNSMARTLGGKAEKWMQDDIIKLRMYSETVKGRKDFLNVLNKTYSKSIVKRIVKLENELKEFSDAVRNINGKLGKPVNIPWANTKGIKTYTWLADDKQWNSLKLPKGASGTFMNLKGSKALAKYTGVKALANPNKTFRVSIVKKSLTRTIDDVSSVTFHESAHAIMDAGSSLFYKGKSLDDFLMSNFEEKIKKSSILRKIFDNLSQGYFQKAVKDLSVEQRKFLIREFYAAMVEVQQAVNSNLKLSLRHWPKLAKVDINKVSQVKSSMADLAKNGKLFNTDELAIFFPKTLSEIDKKLLIKKYGKEKADEMIQVLENGLIVESKKIPYFEPYRHGFVEMKGPKAKAIQNKEIDTTIPKMVKGYEDPNLKIQLDPYDLTPGMLRSITRRINPAKAEDIALILKDIGIQSKPALIKYTNAAIKDGKFPRIDPYLNEFIGKPNEIIRALKEGKVKQMQKMARIKVGKLVKKEMAKPYITDLQRKAIQKWYDEFTNKEFVTLGSVEDLLKSLGIYPNTAGAERLKLFDLEIVGGKRWLSGPLWLKDFGTGSWKRTHPKQASILRGIFTILNTPQTVWKYSVLFLRPGWGVRNIMDNSIKMGLVAEGGDSLRSMKMIAASATPLGWKKTRRAMQEGTGMGKIFEQGTLFAAENANYMNQSAKAISFWLIDRAGLFGKYSERAFKYVLKKKRGLEGMYTKTEVMSKEALFYNATFKYADDAAKLHFESIVKKQLLQKDLILELRALVPGKKNFDKISKLAQDLVEGKLSKTDSKWIIKTARKYKMKDGAILEKGLAEVERVLFDYSDLTKVGKKLRWIFPFWGFYSKNFMLWTKSIASQPGLRKATNFYLRRIEEANSDLPDWYKDRIKVFGDWYTLPFLSYGQVLDVWRDPFKEFSQWMQNKNHPISGLGWNPSISVAIKKFTGKGYWDSEKDLKSVGYTDEMLKRMGVENVNLEKNDNVWAIYARQIPIFSLISTFQDVSNEMLVTMDSAVRSKKLNALSSYFFGVPIIKIDDLNKLWGAYNRALPQDRKDFLAAIPKDKYEDFYKLLAAKNLQKILDATEAGIKDPIYFQYMYDWEYRNKYFKVLNQEGSKEAKYLLATNKGIRGAMDRFWDLLEYSPKRAAGEWVYNKQKVRGVAFQVLKQLNSELKKGMETRPAEWFAVTGEGFEVAYTKEDLQNDIFREDGTLIPETFEELKAMMPELNNLPWLKKIVEESISKSEEFPEEYYRLIKETSKEADDFKYTIEMMTFGKTIYIDSDVESTPEARGAALRAGYDLWDNMSSTTKAIHLERYPAKNVWHEFKSAYTKKLGVMTSQKNIENWFQNFYDDKYFSSKDREVFFIKHPLRKIYYPDALKSAKLMDQDDINRKKGEYSSLGWDYLDKISPKARAAWEKDKPQFWETYKWHKGYQALLKVGNFGKAMEYYWSPNNKGARNRYFLKNPDQLKPRQEQKEHWSMPQNTWEDRQKALDWWFKHPDYIKWTHRYDVTDQQKADSALRDHLKEVNHSIKAEGSGEVFYMDMAKLEAEKRMIYEKNPQLQEEFEEALTGDAKKKYELTQQFFAIDAYDFEAKQKFLEQHPELREGWTAMTPPWERKLLDLQTKYFDLKSSTAKEKFLNKHPELVQYWDSKALPWSYWYDKPKFKQDEAIVVSIIDSIENKKTLTVKEKQILKKPENEDEKYISTKVYQWSMGKWIEYGRIDSTKGWEFFEELPDSIRDIYFLRNPKMKQYFTFTSEWHKRLQISPEEGSLFFNSFINKEWRDMYFDKHPDAEKFFKQLKEVSDMPNKTWEDAQKRRRWWEQHNDLSEWLRRRETKEEKEFREVKESYFAIMDRTPLVGSGKDYWIRYFKVQKEADDFMAEHPELREWFKDHKSGDEKILKLQDEYFSLENSELRNEFLKNNPELKDSWYDKSAPKMREVIELQEGYFAIAKNELTKRSKYLLDNPELLAYWNAQALPHEYYFEPKQFKKFNYQLDQLQKYYDALVDSTEEGEIAFGKLSPEMQKSYLSGDLNEYQKNKAYLLAMNTWMKVIDRNFLRGNYYFKSLPTWIRKRYFTAHPEKQFTFSIPLEDFITEPLKEWEKEHPRLAWAYRTLYEYGGIKLLPNELAIKVEEILIKEGVWRDRKSWGKDEWREYWKELAMLKHEIRAADIKRLPQLQAAIDRAAKQYPMKPRPRPLFRTKPRKGNMKPFI